MAGVTVGWVKLRATQHFAAACAALGRVETLDPTYSSYDEEVRAWRA